MSEQRDCRRVHGLLDEFADGRLRASDAWIVERHVSECPPCARALSEIRTVKLAARLLPRESPPPDFEAVVMQRVSRSGSRRVWRPAWWMPPQHYQRMRLASLGAAAVLGLVAMKCIGPLRYSEPAPTHSAVSSRTGATRLVAAAASDPLEDMAAANLAAQTGLGAPGDRDVDL